MQQHSTTQATTSTVDTQSHQAQASVNNLIGAFVIIFPIMLFVGVKAYKGYRAAVLRKQIATLEKLWELHLKNKSS